MHNVQLDKTVRSSKKFLMMKTTKKQIWILTLEISDLYEQSCVNEDNTFHQLFELTNQQGGMGLSPCPLSEPQTIDHMGSTPSQGKMSVIPCRCP